MKENKLRNHIPIGGPATREPCVGDETQMRVSLGFTPRWYHTRLGIDFSEKWHQDPLYRYDSLEQMKKKLNECFPEVQYFKPDYKNGVEASCATISGVHGAMLMSLIYGLEVVYSKDGWPSANPEKPLSREQIEKLEPLDLESIPVVSQLLEQMDIIEVRWGSIHGYLNYQGVLNNALRIRGNAIFMDMLDEPDLVHHMFGHIAKTMLQLVGLIQERQRKSGFDINLLSVSNCVINMISPDLYEEFVLPYDKMLSQHFGRFGVHTCNWNVTPYIDSLNKIGNIGYIDMGISSDMKRVREVFKDARRALMFSPVALENKSLEEIRADLARVKEELSPCDIVMADVENTTPDERVREFLHICRELEEHK